MELERSNAGSTKGGYSSESKSLVDVVLPRLLLCVLLLLSCLAVSSSSDLVVRVRVNCVTFADVRVTWKITVSTLDLTVLWRVMIGLLGFSYPIDASRCVSSLSHLIQVQEYVRGAMMFSSPCLNWFSFKVDSNLCRDNIFFDLNLSKSSLVFKRYFLYSFTVGKSFECS